MAGKQDAKEKSRIIGKQDAKEKRRIIGKWDAKEKRGIIGKWDIKGQSKMTGKQDVKGQKFVKVIWKAESGKRDEEKNCDYSAGICMASGRVWDKPF